MGARIEIKYCGEFATIFLVGTMGGQRPGDDALIYLFEDGIKTLISGDHVRVVADLQKVSWMNSTGLGALMGAMTLLRNKGGDLKLAKIPDNVENLFAITKLNTIFDTFGTVEDAIAAFSK